MFMSEARASGFRRALVIPHVGKEGVNEMVVVLGRLLEGRGCESFMLPDDARVLGGDASSYSVGKPHDEYDLAIVLGGDGTVLHAVDVLWGQDVPLVGINIGKLGFLTAAEMHRMEDAISEIFSGRYLISERVPVGCTLGNGSSDGELRALNEIVIGKLVRERLIHLSTYINGEFFMRYSGDGLIFSSATGSTAYSLSSGGPIVTPELKCFLLTPICAHMLFSRPMVLDSSDRVTVIVEEGPESLALSIDGREEVEVPPGSTVVFYALDAKVRIMELAGSSFYQTLRSKFLSPPAHQEG